jgi:hypothetical protein
LESRKQKNDDAIAIAMRCDATPPRVAGGLGRFIGSEDAPVSRDFLRAMSLLTQTTDLQILQITSNLMLC